VEEERTQEGKEEGGMREGGDHYNILSTRLLTALKSAYAGANKRF
jgi:hypothetical protein